MSVCLLLSFRLLVLDFYVKYLKVAISDPCKYPKYDVFLPCFESSDKERELGSNYHFAVFLIMFICFRES